MVTQSKCARDARSKGTMLSCDWCSFDWYSLTSVFFRERDTFVIGFGNVRIISFQDGHLLRQLKLLWVSVCGSRGLGFVTYLRMDSYSVICGDVSRKKLRLATYVKSGWEIIDVAILFDLFSLILICKATRSILAIAKDYCDARKWEFKFVVESAMHSGIWIPCKNVPHCAFFIYNP